MEHSSIKAPSAGTISIFWTWWWSACPSSPLEYSECSLVLFSSLLRFWFVRCFGMFTQRRALIFTKIYGHNSERRFPLEPALLSRVHFCNYKINISQPVNGLYPRSVPKKIKSRWKAAKWGNVFICKGPHASRSSLFFNNFTLHYSQSPSFFVMFIKLSLLLAANNSLKCSYFLMFNMLCYTLCL